MPFAQTTRNAAALALLALAVGAPISALELHAVQFPERRSVQLEFTPAPGAPLAKLSAEILYRDGQARINLNYDDMKPAVLYGGDVTCYVLWAVTVSGVTENLGELLVREPKGRLEFATGKKEFALLVTAEPYYLVSRPSDLIAFNSGRLETKRESSQPFAFDAFVPAADHAMNSIREIAWASDTPLDLIQARKAYEVATRREAAIYAPQIYGEAEAALAKANEIARKSQKSRELFDHARRSVALSNEAINMTVHRLETRAIEAQLATRRAEMEAIERRARKAESDAEAARKTADLARAAADASRDERARLAEQVEDLALDRTALEGDLIQLRGKADKLAVEKMQLRRQLESALSHVADTKQTARGLVVNLPDILFDVNRTTLKHETQIILAKLSGILLMMPDIKATIEGHTDATGSESYNLQLSERRAVSVLEFVESQGVDLARLSATGFGMSRPVADNDTSDGRAKNRRVEIIIGNPSVAANRPVDDGPEGS